MATPRHMDPVTPPHAIRLNPRRAWHPTKAILGLCAATLLAGTPGFAAPPLRVAVLPFQPTRHEESEGWFGRYAQVLLREALLRTGEVAVMPGNTALRWQQKLELGPLGQVDAATLERLGVDALVHGSTQTVLDLTRVRLRVTGPAGAHTPKDGLALQWRLEEVAPHAVAAALTAKTLGALRLSKGPPLPSQPPAWSMVRAFYGGMDNRQTSQKAAAAPAQPAYAQWIDTPGLAAKAHGALALADLHRSQSTGAVEPRIGEALASALQHAQRAVNLEPWNPGWLALLGEVHLFRKEFYPSKSAASTARLRNPLDGLPALLLAMESGLSTGDGKRFMRLALEREPFLLREALPRPDAPYQGGLLDATMANWRRVHTGNAPASAAYTELMQSARTAFDASRWEEAGPLYVEAAGMDDSDHEPHLYLSRILMAEGRTNEAVHRLRTLTAEYPQEADVHYRLGLALAETNLPAEAATAFARVLGEDPGHQDARYALALAHMAQRQWERAVEPLRTLLLRDPRDEAGWLRLGIVYGELQQWEAAAGALRQVLALNPHSAEAKAMSEQFDARRQDMERLEGESTGN